MSEAMGPSNLTQVLDLDIPGSSPYTPIYGLYENGNPVRVAAFNYVDDPSGASDITVVISIAGGATPTQVKVKYLAASSVSQKGGYTWAGQVCSTSSGTWNRIYISLADVRWILRVGRPNDGC